MKFTRADRVLPGLTAAFAIAAAITPSLCQADPAEGLWVGRAVLREVNEAVGAVDENNVRVQTPPGQTTPTQDAAEIFLIVHVVARRDKHG